MKTIFLTVLIPIASFAGPVIGPPLKDGSLPVWLDDKAILVQTIVSLTTLIIILGKSIIGTEKKRYDKVMQVVEEHFPKIERRLEDIERRLKDVPTSAEIELTILRRELEIKTRGK